MWGIIEVVELSGVESWCLIESLKTRRAANNHLNYWIGSSCPLSKVVRVRGHVSMLPHRGGKANQSSSLVISNFSCEEEKRKN